MRVRKTQRGVTMIELLTVVLVLGVLASLAVPSYRRYLLRAQRSDATTALLRLATAQEKHLLQFGSYVTTTASLPNTHAAGGLGIPVITEQGFYDLTVAATTTGYTATATKRSSAGQRDDNTCATFTINEGGTRRAYNSTSVDKTTECFR
jgi:type IV pilus assembly protein PilE